MPTYHCISPAGVLDAERRHRVAQAITQIHEEVGGSAGFFAHVYFTETPPGAYFVGGHALEGDHLAIQGFTRAGRKPEVLTLLVASLVTTVSEAADLPQRKVWVYLGELPHGQMAEWGHVVPAIGDEQPWFAAMPEDDRVAIERFAAKLSYPPKPTYHGSLGKLPPRVEPAEPAVRQQRV